MAESPETITLYPCPTCGDVATCQCGLECCGHRGEREPARFVPVAERDAAREQIDWREDSRREAVQAQIDAEAELAAVTRERDEARTLIQEHLTCEDECRKADRLAVRVKESEARLNEAVLLLKALVPPGAAVPLALYREVKQFIADHDDVVLSGQEPE